MAMKAKHAFGMLENIDAALSNNTIDSYDILFVKDANGKPYVGWIDKDGNKVIVQEDEKIVRVDELPTTNGDENVVYIYNNECYIWDGSQCVSICKPTDLTKLEAEVAKKADADEVDEKIGEIETVLDGVTNVIHTHEKVKYEFTDVPVGTLVDYREDEIRVMCPAGSVFNKQSVGVGGDANKYYATFKTYVPNDDVVGYIEHIGDQVDNEILTTFSTDEFGRRYQPTWLALASYDETSDTWTYYGKNSSINKYIGWDYQIDWYNADGVIIASDSVRINLSNENCHSSIEPYYVGTMKKDIETMVTEKIAEVESAYEIIEF